MTDLAITDLTVRQQLAVCFRILGQADYQDKITGHMTWCDRDDNTFLVNPVDVFWSEMRARDLLRVERGRTILEGTRRYNETAESHFEIHARRPDARVVLHNHPPYGNIWAAAVKMPPLLDQSGANGGGRTVLVSEYKGTLDNEGPAKSLAEAFGTADVAILAHHGVLVAGADLGIVMVRALSFEWRCRRAYEVASMGLQDPEELPKEAAEILETYAPAYGDLLLEVYGRKVIADDPSVLDDIGS